MIIAKALITRLVFVLPALAIGCATEIAWAQTDEANVGSAKYKVLYIFTGADGANPRTGLVQGTDGDFYGVTQLGGAGSASGCSTSPGCGTIFKITPTGTLTTFYNFCTQTGCLDGAEPNGLIQAANGGFYGITGLGGAYCPPYGCGTVFKMSPNGALTTLYSFCAQSNCPDGNGPTGLIQAANGDFYGTTKNGGASNNGTIFKITSTGTFTTLYSFCASGTLRCPDGAVPDSGLVEAASGDFYGTTHYGGGTDNRARCGFGCGTIFKVTATGTLTTLYDFCVQTGCPDGYNPSAGLIQATNGNLYGTTGDGGGGVLPTGSVYSITPDGAFATIYDFCFNCSLGTAPSAPLVQAASGNFYGTTTQGGIDQPYCYYPTCGTIFKITPSGMLTALYSFCSQAGCADGQLPNALIQGTDGIFYGTTFSGGAMNCTPRGCGAIFTLSTGQSPFVEIRPRAGHAGEVVTILGNNLTGTTSVTFNGIPARFKVASAATIFAKVPVAATTGKVRVVTPSGTLSSNVAFEIH